MGPVRVTVAFDAQKSQPGVLAADGRVQSRYQEPEDGGLVGPPENLMTAYIPARMMGMV